MGRHKKLTEMQMRFAEYIVFGGPDGPMSQTEAAIKAGYSEKRARSEGSELMNPRFKSFPSSGELNFNVKDPDEVMKKVLEKYASSGIIDTTDGLSITFSDWRFNLRKSKSIFLKFNFINCVLGKNSSL